MSTVTLIPPSKSRLRLVEAPAERIDYGGGLAPIPADVDDPSLPSDEARAAVGDALNLLQVWCATCAAADTLRGVVESGNTADILWNAIQAVILALDQVHEDVPHEFHLVRGTVQAIELYLCAYVQREPGENDHGMWALEVPTTLRGSAAYAAACWPACGLGQRIERAGRNSTRKVDWPCRAPSTDGDRSPGRSWRGFFISGRVGGCMEDESGPERNGS